MNKKMKNFLGLGKAMASPEPTKYPAPETLTSEHVEPPVKEPKKRGRKKKTEAE